MKKFTVKDFLKLNSPCYGCGGKINLRVGMDPTDRATSTTFHNLIVRPSGYFIRLYHTYNDSLDLLIEPRTNKFGTSNGQAFINFIKNRNLFVMTVCDTCQTNIISQHLEFNIIGGYIKPVGIATEYLILQDRNNKYVIMSQFMADKSNITVFSMKGGVSTSLSEFELPLLPHYRFKDKEHFMNKLKTYMLFS